MKPVAVLALALLLPACASTKAESFTKAGFEPAIVQRLAVVDGNNPTFKAETRQTLVDTAQMEFLRAGWSLVERENIQKAIDEMNFQNSDITAPDQRQQLGQVLNVDALAFVNIGGKMDEISISIKMVDVATGELLWMGSGEGDLNTMLSAVTGVVVGAAVGAAVGNQVGSGHGGTGAAAGGVLGGVVGAGLTPSELENAKDLVKEICKGLPRRA